MRAASKLVSVSALVSGIVCAAALPEQTVPQSCGMQLKTKDCTPEMLDEIAGLGFKYVRRGFLWEAIEKEKGVYDFSAYDTVLEDARKKGLRVLGCIAFGNKLYGSVREPAGRDAYAAYAAELAKRYKDHHILWEIWNEPNTMTFWGKHGRKGNTEQYALEYLPLVKAAVAAMRKADPECFVMGGSVSCLWSESFNWIDACFKHGMLDTGINAWSVHPYGTKSPEDNIENFAHLREILAKYKVPKDFPILNSERGYPVKKAEGWSGGPASEAHQYQAWHFVRQYMIDQLCDLKLTIWYEWSGDEFGFYQGKDNVRPAYHAAKVLTAQLDGYRFSKRLPLESELDFALLFSKPTGEQKLVVWAAAPKGQSPDKTKNHEVALAVEGQAACEVCDLYGKKSAAEVADGKIKVTLTGSPQYLALPPKR